jgi:hypothetical protein
VVITNAGADLTYEPADNYCNDPPGTTPDTFTYTLTPGGSSATVSVTVTCVNDAPVLTDATPDYTAIGNTQLRAGATPPVIAAVAFSTDASNALAKAGPVTDVDGPGPIGVVAASGASANGGTFSIEADGDFTYHPPTGFTGTDTFAIQVTDNGTPAGLANATVTVAVSELVWYVQNDTATAGNAATSVDPANTLAEAETPSTADDFIYVFQGNGTDSGQNAGITLKNGQKFLGEGVDLVVSAITLVTGNPANKPLVSHTAGNAVTVLANTANGPRTGIEIRGLSLSTTGVGFNAIDATSADAAALGVTISDNTITGAPAEGIDVNQGSTSVSSTLALSDNVLTATGAAVDVQRTAGTLTVTAFHDNVVTGASVGGIAVTGVTNPVIFDVTPGGGIQPVPGGTTVIGTPGDRIGGPGLSLNNVTGALNYANAAAGPIGAGDLDIFTDSGAALSVTGGAGGFDVDVTPNVGVLVANAGPAAVLSAVSNVDLQWNSLTSTNSAATGVSLTNVTGTFSAPSGSAITNAGTTDFLISGGTANVTYGGTITDDLGQLVSVASTTGGTKTFSGAITDGNDGDGSGISISGNTGGLVSFTGQLTLSTGANPALSVSGAGTVNATNAGNRITTTTGTALNVNGPDIAAGGLVFTSIASSGAVSGIILQDTGAVAGLTVTGTGSAGTGGTIASSTGPGISLTNAAAINLSFMNIQNGGNDGIRGSGVTGLNMTSLNITSNGNAVGEWGVDLTQLTGSGSMANCTVSGSAENNVVIANTSGTLSAFNVTASSFLTTNMTTGDDGFRVENNGSGAMTVSITGSTFTDNKGDHFQAATSASATGTLAITFSNNTLTTTAGNDPNVVGGGITVSPSGSADLTFTISSNDIQQAFDEAINLNLGTAATAAASMIGTISNNTVGTAGDVDSGSESGTGISVISNGAGLTTVSITNNTVRQYANPYGILVNNKEGSTSMNATITGNTVANPGSFAINGIRVDAGATAGDNGTMCAHISGNSVAGSGPGADTDIRLRQRFLTTIRLPGYAGANTDTAAVNAFVAGNNAGSDVSSVENVGGGGGGFVGGAACPTP